MKKFAVVGSPIAHSLSPTLHRAVFAHFNVDYSYERYEVAAGQLRNFWQGQSLTGLSLTMPLKEEALRLADVADDFAIQAQAVNTLMHIDNGLRGFNTDVPGLRSALEEAGVTAIDQAVVVGSGATARSALVALRPLTRTLLVMARNEAAANELDADSVVPMGETSALASADVVVSTIPAGADDLPIGEGLLFDLIYSPWPTVLASRWRGRTLSGVELLIHQAALQSQIFLQRPLDLAEVRRLMRAAL